MSYRADKQVVDTHTHTHGHTDRHTDAGDDNTRRPKLASGKKVPGKNKALFIWYKQGSTVSYRRITLKHQKTSEKFILTCNGTKQ